MSSAPNTVTREELYQQIWNVPAIQLAKQYGISDVAMAKICKKMNIPKPGLGYWAKLQAGHPVNRVPLPPPTHMTNKSHVTIKRHPRPRLPVALTPELLALVEAEALPANRITAAPTSGTHTPLSNRPRG